jgi:micrococcal nuclease
MPSVLRPIVPPSDESALVVRVIDGDTVELANGDRVRYLGVDTPETVNPQKPVGCFGPEASAANKRLVEGKRVVLTSDVTDRDKYSRLLRFVSVGGIDVAAYLIQNGFGYVYSIQPDVARLQQYGALEREAHADQRGLWGACPQ